MKKSMLALSLLSVAAASNGTSNPATTAYVDQQVAAAKASLVSLIGSSGSSVAHPVGSCYGGGIVFYVNTALNAPAGQRGLIVALADAASSRGVLWEPLSPLSTTITTSQDYFKGLENTTNILATGASPQTQFPAAAAAHDYTTADTCDTCTDWYLPSLNELSALYGQAKTSGSPFWTNCSGATPSQTFYWSSTQYTAGFAWFAQFTGRSAGYVFLVNAVNQYGVRPVRAF